MESMLRNLVPEPFRKREVVGEQNAVVSTESVPTEAPVTLTQQIKMQSEEEAVELFKKHEAQKKPKQVQNKAVDHGRIVALYKANPPRSIKWIAEDCKCSEQTVVNHLIKEGIYKRKSERKETV